MTKHIAFWRKCVSKRGGCMKNSNIYFKEDTQTKEDNVINEIPPDDGHQMCQSEIDNLIALLLNQ